MKKCGRFKCKNKVKYELKIPFLEEDMFLCEECYNEIVKQSPNIEKFVREI